MGTGSSTVGHLRQLSQRHRARGYRISCLGPVGHDRRRALVVVVSQCTTDVTWQVVIKIIETYGESIRLHATTDDYDNVKKIGDKYLLKYLNEKLFIHKVDFSSETSVEEFWRDVLKMELTIDAIVLHMDEMCVKSADGLGPNLISSLFDHNLFAPMLFIKSVLPALKAQKKGKIICLTTVGGTIGIPLHSLYCSTKFALEGLLESLASECMQHSITVSIVQTSLDKEQDPSKFVVELPHNGSLSPSNDMEEKMQKQDETVRWLEREGLLKDMNAIKISRIIKGIIDAKEPNFRYIICKRCNTLMKEKLKDLHGCITINEVSKFFLNADLD